jgi:iron complex outermembrane recepter protein
MDSVKIALLTSVALATGSYSTSAFAQNNDTTQEAETRTLQTVTVRATRRDDSIADVPIQVTALGADDLIEADVITLEDLGARVPNTYIGANSGYNASAISIRGVGGTLSTGGEEPVAVFFDDQFISRYFPNTLMDLESIEVLRGPQVTLYGRNATAGAVLLRSARPDLDELTGFGRVQIADFGEERYEGALSIPVATDAFAVRIAGAYTERDGWVTNTVNGENMDRFESGRIRGSFLWIPSDRTEVYANVEYSESNFSVARAGIAADRNPGGNRRLISESALDSLRDGNFAADSPVSNDGSDLRASLSYTHEFDKFDLVVTGGYFYQKVNGETDSDGTGAMLLDNNGTLEYETFTQDLRLVSSGDGKFEWIVGLSAVQDDYRLPGFQIRNYSAFAPDGLDLRFFGEIPATAYAAYAEGTYDLTDKLSVTLGGRYTYEEKEADIGRDFRFLTSGGPFSGGVLTFQDEANWTAFKPRAIVEYAASGNTNLYGSISTGFKSGGYNVFALTDEFDEENIVAYEVGAKGSLLDGVINYSAAAFYYDYTDLQLRLGVPTGGVIIQNAADAEISGFEFEASADLTEELDLFGSFSFLDTSIKEYITRDLSGNLIDAAGAELARAPDFQFAFGGSYERQLGESYFGRVSANVTHRSEVFFLETDQDADTFRGEPLTEVNFRVAFGPQDGSWELAGFVQNLSDEVEVTQVELQGNFPQASFNEPRKFGVELITRF